MKIFLCIFASCVLISAASSAELMTNIGGPEIHQIARELHLGFTERGNGSYDLKYKGNLIWALQIGNPDQPLVLSYYSNFKHPSLKILNLWNDQNDFGTAVLDGKYAELKASFYFSQGASYEAFKDFFRRFTLATSEFENFQKRKAEQGAAANP